jgi:hypothetical protein
VVNYDKISVIEVNFENFSRLLTRSSDPSTNFKSIFDLADKGRPPSAVQKRGTFPSTSLTSSDSDSHGSVGTGDRGSSNVTAERRAGVSKNPMKCAPPKGGSGKKGATYSQKQSDLHQQATAEQCPRMSVDNGEDENWSSCDALSLRSRSSATSPSKFPTPVSRPQSFSPSPSKSCPTSRSSSRSPQKSPRCRPVKVCSLPLEWGGRNLSMTRDDLSFIGKCSRMRFSCLCEQVFVGARNSVLVMRHQHCQLTHITASFYAPIA